MQSEEYIFEVFADYFQFYLRDEESDEDASGDWTEQAVKDMLAVASQEIVIGTARNMNVPVEIEIRADEPKEDSSLWDHITECSFSVPSEKIIVAGCTDFVGDADRFKIAPGAYRARVFYGRLDDLSDDGLEGGDHYKIVLWRGAAIEPRVIKRRNENGRQNFWRIKNVIRPRI